MIKLIQHLEPVRSQSLGVASSDIKKLALDEQLSLDIIEAMDSKDEFEKYIGLLFTKSLSDRIQNKENEILRFFETKVTSFLLENTKIQLEALAIIECLETVASYKEIARGYFYNEEPQLRFQSLKVFSKCSITDEDILEIMKFEKDEYYSEIKMNGGLRYLIRDFCFDTIAEALNIECNKNDVTSVNEKGTLVSYIDWTPIKKTVNSRKKSFWSKIFKGDF